MPKTVLLLLLIFASACGTAHKTEEIIDTFFNKYQSETIDSSIEYLFSTNKWANQSKAELDQMKVNLNETVKDLGLFYGYEEVSRKVINQNLIEYTFHLRYDVQPLRFKILFYKPKDEWRAQNFQFDNKLYQD